MIITSKTNSHIKEIVKLKEKKYRDLTDSFIVEGEHLVEEALKVGLVSEIIAISGASYPPFSNCIEVSEDVMQKISSLDSVPKVIAICHKKPPREIGSRVLALEDIQDPGNLGTIIRSAVAFGIDTIILSNNTVDPYNPKVVRSTQGMLFHINILTANLYDEIVGLKEKKYKIMGTRVEGGSDVCKVSVPSQYVLIIGNEGHGMSKEIGQLCDDYLYIKMNSKVESLNASIAASILLYELSRRED